MLTKVEVRTLNGDLLSLPMEDISSGFVVQNIDGLDPVKATLVTSTFAKRNGVQYHSSKLDPRNIVITLGLQPNYSVDTVKSLRDRLYDFFISDSPVSLRFYDSGGLIVDIDGRVETCESPLFAKEPQMAISIMCFEPSFVDVLAPVTFNGNSVATTTETPLTYLGNQTTGVTFAFMVNRSIASFSIYQRTPDGNLHTMDVNAAFVAGDVVTINTVVGSKSAILTRGGSNSSILYAIPPQADWLTLAKGVNTMRVFVSGAAIPYKITYNNRYGGL